MDGVKDSDCIARKRRIWHLEKVFHQAILEELKPIIMNADKFMYVQIPMSHPDDLQIVYVRDCKAMRGKGRVVAASAFVQLFLAG